MPRRLDQPTHIQLFLGQIWQYLAYAFVVVFVITFMFFWTLHYSLQRDCTDLYKRDVNLFGMWFHVDAGRNKDGCPAQP